jgi:CO/xanthine dehydrogenase FAD-binding subunit
MPPFELVAPATESEALAELADRRPGEVTVLAGGTDLLFDLDARRITPRRVVSLRRLPWRTHAWEGGGLTVGATEPLAVLEADPELGRRVPALAQAVAAVGSPALREQATVGGNLGRAAPASDLIPVLLALDAEVDTVSLSGARRLPLDDFLRTSRETALGRDELIRSVRLPEERPSSAYLWQRVRPANDISQIGVAVAFSPREHRWRVSLGGIPPRPVLAREAAGELDGPRPGEREVAAASERVAAHPALVSDRRATEEHRRRLASVLCARALAATIAAPGGRP